MVTASIVLRGLTVLWAIVLLWRLREWRVWFWGAISLLVATMLMSALHISSVTAWLLSPPAEAIPAVLMISITRLVVVVVAERALAGRARAATKLEANQNLHRHLVEDSLGLMCVHDLNGVMQSINPSAAQALGYRPEDGIGRNMREFLAPSARHEVDSYLDRIRRNRTASGLIRLVARDGGERIWSYRNVLYEEPGAPPRVFGHAQDITERKRAEKALRKSEQRFDLAARGANDGIWDLNVITGKNYWSPRLYELLGYEDEEIGASLDAFRSHLHPDDSAYAIEALRVHLEDRVPYDIEYRLRTKSGEYRWFRARGQAVWDETGTAVRMAGSIQDISDRKQAERALAAERDLLRTVIDHLPDLVYVKDSGGRFTVVNAAYAKSVGSIAPDTIVGKEDLDLFPKDRAERYQIEDQAVMQSGRPIVDREWSISDKPGNRKWFLTTKVPLHGRGEQVAGLVAISRDISAPKEAEQKLRAAHDELEWRVQERTKELEDANAALQAGIEERKRAGELLRKSEADLRRSSEKLRALTARLITAQEEQSKRISRELHDDFNQNIAALAKFSHRNIRRGLSKDVALCVYRVVQESLQNVRKHSDAKQAEVSVTETKGRVCLAVSDDGVGFDTELQSGERGIGLSNIEERVRLVSGSFSVQSRPGEGTRVDVRIPLPKRV